MKTFFLASTILSSLASLASAAAVKPGISTLQSTSTVTATCFTLLGQASVASVGTAYHTQIIHSIVHLTSTSTPSTTVYPSTQATTTSSMVCMTTISVIAPVSTDYYTSYSTNYQTTTFTANASTTITINLPTTVLTTQTITIPTSAGFVPAASGVGYPGAKKRFAGPHNHFDIEAQGKKSKSVSNASPTSNSSNIAMVQVQNGVPVVSPAAYPSTVSCEALIEAFTTLETIVTATSTATITAAPFTSTAFIMANITSTTTILPQDAQVTTIFIDEIAVSSTTTSTQTFTTTISNVVTLAAPSATYYAACAANNLLSTANGQQFGAMQISGTVQPRYYYQYEPSAYECCAVCMRTPNCAGASYVDGTCSVYPIGGTNGNAGGTCNPNIFIGDYFPYAGGDPQTIINGPCGQFGYGMGACYRDNGGFC